MKFIVFENLNAWKADEGLGFTLFSIDFYDNAMRISLCDLVLRIYYPWIRLDQER